MSWWEGNGQMRDGQNERMVFEPVWLIPFTDSRESRHRWGSCFVSIANDPVSLSPVSVAHQPDKLIDKWSEWFSSFLFTDCLLANKCGSHSHVPHISWIVNREWTPSIHRDWMCCCCYWWWWDETGFCSTCSSLRPIYILYTERWSLCRLVMGGKIKLVNKHHHRNWATVLHICSSTCRDQIHGDQFNSIGRFISLSPPSASSLLLVVNYVHTSISQVIFLDSWQWWSEDDFLWLISWYFFILKWSTNVLTFNTRENRAQIPLLLINAIYPILGWIMLIPSIQHIESRIYFLMGLNCFILFPHNNHVSCLTIITTNWWHSI